MTTPSTKHHGFLFKLGLSPAVTWTEPSPEGWDSPSPPALSPLLSYKTLASRSFEMKEQYLVRRGFALLMVIEGLRSGFYVAAPDSNRLHLIARARKKYRRLIRLGQSLGFWLNGSLSHSDQPQLRSKTYWQYAY